MASKKLGKISYFSANGLFNHVHGRGKGNMFDHEGTVPLRMLGYAHLRTGDIPDFYRKRIDSAIRRGYLLESNTPVPFFLELLMCAVDDPLPIGYVGKQAGYIWLDSEKEAEECFKQAIATNMMLDEVTDNNLRHSVGRSVERSEVHFHRGIRNPVRYAREEMTMLEVTAFFDDGSFAPQLKHCMKSVRKAFDSYLKAWAPRRNAVAEQLTDDDFTVLVPFDSSLGWVPSKFKS